MKKQFTYLLVLLFTNILVAQKLDEFMNVDDFDDIYGLKICYVNCNTGSEVDNFSFSTSSFSNALANQALLERAKLANMRAWFSEQKNIIKEHLEKKLGESFSNYNTAKDALFLASEEKNIAVNVPIVTQQYAVKTSPARAKQTKLVKNLKLLALREAEFNTGSYAIVKYPFIEIDGVALKDMTSGTIDNIKNGTLADFYGNAATLHDLELTYSFLQRMAGNENFKDKIVDLKNSYYKSFSDWDELNYMQFLINYEEIKRLNSYPNFYPELISLFNKFKNTDIATNTVIEEYALDNRGGEMSVFDDDYWKEILEEYRKSSLYIFQPNLFGQNFLMLTFKAIEEHKERKQAALEALLNDVNIDDTSFAIANLIGRLQITDEDQIKWLNHYTNRTEVLSIIDYVEENTYRSSLTRETKEFVMLVIEALTNGNEVDFDERLINLLEGNALCVFNKLKELDLYKSTVQKFENSNTYDLFIKLQFGDCNDQGGNACTDASSLESGYITINLQGNDNTNLDLAATILHEAIHAEIYKYVDEYKKGLDPNDRVNLLFWYNHFKSENDNRENTSDAQHEHMADKYVKPIAEAIRELDNNKYSLDYYLGFAWDGLREYGFNKYRNDDGTFVELDDSGYATKQQLVNDNSDFNINCN